MANNEQPQTPPPPKPDATITVGFFEKGGHVIEMNNANLLMLATAIAELQRIYTAAANKAYGQTADKLQVAPDDPAIR